MNDENSNDPNRFLQRKPAVPRTVRPLTANVKSTQNLGPVKKANKAYKKSDPVSRYQSLQNEWKKSKNLVSNNKEGRKLDLDRFHKWSSLVHAHNS